MPDQQFPGIDGFLGGRGSLMLDVVFLAMFAVVPLLGYSIYAVKFRRRFALHKRLQLAMGGVLLLAVAAFEIDMRLHDWTPRAVASPYFDPLQPWNCPVGVSLIVHLCFSVPTFLLWIFVSVQAVRKFANPPAPGSHSPAHLVWAKLASVGMLLTSITGWIFYWLAFWA